MDRQPFLHDLSVSLRAPTVVLSGRDGQVRRGGVQGAFHADIRVLAYARVLVGGCEPDPLVVHDGGPGEVTYVGIVRDLGDSGGDPTVRLTRRRTIEADGLTEEIELSSTAAVAVATEVRLAVATDLAAMAVVRGGGAAPDVAPDVLPDGFGWAAGDDDAVRVELTGEGAAVDAGEVVLRWRLRVADPGRVVVPATTAVPWSRPLVEADDRRLAVLLDWSLADLDALRLATAARPGETFLAAGAPWYFTLFGRDSLWAARMLLPLGTDLAASTLRALVAFQGTRHDPDTAEAPGKIPHELRREALVGRGGLLLPPAYYGTVDATPLWMILLHDAWRWGLAPEEVEPLLPHLEAAATWLLEHADPDGDGFLEYVDESGHGLANQGWKDSPDAVRFRDGGIAEGPIALCEVQGYAHEAARAAAALLDAFGRPGAERLRVYADALATAFRERFWVEDERGAYPALALDGDKRPADAVTSNIGHLLGTGLLDAREAALVAERVTSPDMDSGFGLRTMSADSGGYSPLSYHCGTVWPHDTAVVATGLMREGHSARAAALAAGLVRAAPGFDHRLPELFAGDAREGANPATPYPASCRPQAWAAASAVSVLLVLLGLRPDIPGGVVDLRPASPTPVGALRVDGLVVGADRLTVEVDRDGRLVSASGCDLVRTSAGYDPPEF
ncbi:MAG: amylo-alpha-1,6-glucosidase [Streptosporangiales bacterium]|nr:amylo-alpha-1,6-glucosidase [Streptosporangiales bacterium]